MLCLPKEITDKFLKKLKDGEYTPEKLSDMTSQERHDAFSEIMGETNAQKVNALFETKLLLKNQQDGILNWAKKVGGLSPEAQRDIVSRVNRMERVLEPKDLDAFLADLARQKIGIGITMEEAGRISELAKAAAEKKAAMEKGGDRLEYGASFVEFDNYVKGLKEEAAKLTPFDRLKYQNWTKNISDLAGTAKALKASLDNSAIFRQGWKTLWTNPVLWAKNAQQTYFDAIKVMKGEKVLDSVKAEIVSRENFDRMQKAKLAVGVTEEMFPTTLPEKIPGLGRIYKASETAYTGFVYRMRADVFDKYIEIAQKSGVDINDRVELESIGKLVNSLTGRGNLGPGEKVANVVNNVFFSPRALKANVDTLTLHAFDNMSGFARKQAAINLLKVVAGTAAVLAVAKGINPDSVEEDPRSADFGKIRVGDTRFDVTGGMASIAVLASRLITKSSKSSTSGVVSKLDSGEFGSATSPEVVMNFFMNKLSPVAAVIKDLWTGKDFKGNKPTLLGELQNLLVPFPITTYMELKDNPNSANILLAMLADAHGLVANTYSATANWETAPGVELKQFKEKIGPQEFIKANDRYNSEVNAWLKDKLRDESFQKLDDEEKKSRISEQKSKIKDRIFKDYRFIYRKELKK